MNIWHANDAERSEHNEFINEITGPVIGGHTVQIHWKDYNGDVVVNELRDIRIFGHSDDSFFIDFHAKLSSEAGLVVLDGDLQHAGVQFRASQFVAEHASLTKFIRPGRWSHLPNDKELVEEDRIDLPWNTMQFTIEGTPYSVTYMSHSLNPDGPEMSERNYGRFGEFFPYNISEDKPLEVRYRFWVVIGESPSVDEINNKFQIYLDQF